MHLVSIDLVCCSLFAFVCLACGACLRARVCACTNLIVCSDYKEFEENPELDHYDDADLDNTKYAPMSGMCVLMWRVRIYLSPHTHHTHHTQATNGAKLRLK